MNQRLLTALTAAALAVSLAACSDSAEDAPETPSATAAPSTAASDSSTAAPAETATDAPEENGGSDDPEDPMTMPGHPDIPIVPGTEDAFTGSWRDPNGGAIITFADDGTLTSTDGCNNFESTWTLESGSGGAGSAAIVDPFPVTKMACAGPWSPWVVSIHQVDHDGDRLTATTQGGTGIGELIPAVSA